MSDTKSLQQHTWMPFYSRNNCTDIISEFFVPALSVAVAYERTTYTFGPRALKLAAQGIAGLVNNGGRMRLICNHQLPVETVRAILAGQRAAEDAILDSLSGQSITAVDPDDLAGWHHLQLLTWLVKEQRLEIKVAVPRHANAIFHQKAGIITDTVGDRIAFNTSINEGASGWLHNDENLTLFTSWQNRPHLEPIVTEFEQLWADRADSSKVIPIPEALQQQLIDLAPQDNPTGSLNEKPAIKKEGLPRTELWRTISHAVTHDQQTTLETIPVQLWPHQLSFWRRYARDVEIPPRVLIADEVGLGKTIQAGALLKTLMNRGLVSDVLILTPAMARWQWQDELQQKFNIDAPVLDRRGSKLELAGPASERELASSQPWRQASPVILSYDWLRHNSEAFFNDHPNYDLVIFDEAHRARYQNVSNVLHRRPNSYLEMLRRISKHTQGLLLLTATPMQIDPSELWALLEVLRPDGLWNEEEFQQFYDIGQPITAETWHRAKSLWLRDGFPGTLEEIIELSRMPSEKVRRHLNFINTTNPVTVKKYLTEENIQESLTMMRRSAGIKRSVSRHTRNLLRQYVEQGLLDQSVPERDVKAVVIDMNDEERKLYSCIRDLVTETYQSPTRITPQARGFVMTHFRSRLGSSQYAFAKSLEDLQERRRAGRASTTSWDEILDQEQDDFPDFDPEAEIPDVVLTSAGEQMLEKAISQCRNQSVPDSKFAALKKQLEQLRADGYAKVMVFSQFHDTQVWLRERLAQLLQSVPLAGLSGKGDWIHEAGANSPSNSRRDLVVQYFRENQDGILLCTETAAESLNFQFCSAIINYDIPWNPMRLEQRIGRIDRIGQALAKIRIIHLFYRDTIEHDAYEAMKKRVEAFTDNVGVLQPILSSNLERIIRSSILDEGTAECNVTEKVMSLEPTISFDLDDLAAVASDQIVSLPALSCQDLAAILSQPKWLPEGFGANYRGTNHWQVHAPNHEPRVVTTDRSAHEYAAGSVRFFGPGCPGFPSLATKDPHFKPQRTVREIIGSKVSITNNNNIQSAN